MKSSFSFWSLSLSSDSASTFSSIFFVSNSSRSDFFVSESSLA